MWILILLVPALASCLVFCFRNTISYLEGVKIKLISLGQDFNGHASFVLSRPFLIFVLNHSGSSLGFASVASIIYDLLFIISFGLKPQRALISLQGCKFQFCHVAHNNVLDPSTTVTKNFGVNNLKIAALQWHLVVVQFINRSLNVNRWFTNFEASGDNCDILMTSPVQTSVCAAQAHNHRKI